MGNATEETLARMLSAKQVSWTFATSTTARQLARPWSVGLTVATGDAVVRGGNIYVATTGGTTLGSGTGPTTLGAGIADGTVTWTGYAGATFPGGLSVTNADGTNVVLVGDATVQNAPAPPNYGSMAQLPPDPTASYAKAGAGTPVVYVVGLS